MENGGRDSGNGYREKWIQDRFSDFYHELDLIRESIKVINDHSGEWVEKTNSIEQKVIRLEECIKPIRTFVYGLVGIVLTTVVAAILALVIITK